METDTSEVRRCMMDGSRVQVEVEKKMENRRGSARTETRRSSHCFLKIKLSEPDAGIL